ncbi:MAG: ribosome maturation factor RimM [Alphaproteobacteria bacterium]
MNRRVCDTMDGRVCDTTNRRVLVGVIVGAQGIQGQLRIRSFTERPMDVGAYGPVEDGSGQRTFRLVVVGERGQGVVLARIAGVLDRNAAESLKGIELYVPRSALPPPEEEDDYYWSDLIGLRVVEEGADPSQVSGTVRAVHDFGAGSLLEVALPGVPSVMVPFSRAAVPVVDLDQGYLQVTRAALSSDAGEPEEGQGR